MSKIWTCLWGTYCSPYFHVNLMYTRDSEFILGQFSDLLDLDVFLHLGKGAASRREDGLGTVNGGSCPRGNRG